MTVNEFYQKVDGNYTDAINRLLALCKFRKYYLKLHFLSICGQECRNYRRIDKRVLPMMCHVR